MNNWKLYIANRIHFDKQHRKKATPPAVRVAVAGVALGLAIMILSVAIVIGFKKEIRSKVVGFGAHIQITSFDNNMTYEKQPIQYTDSLREILSECDDITKIDPIGTKLGMIKTDTDFMGTVLKGVTPDYNWSFFKKYLVDGCLPKIQDSIISNEVLVSKTIADKLDFSDYDKLLIIGDVRHVQRLNDWNPDQYSEIELMIKDFDRADDIAYELYTQLIDRPDDYGTHYYPQSIRTLNPVFFGWLDLLDMNVWIILILMAAVSGFTMISGLLIIILERANMIGILKALGANNTSIRKIFLYVSVFLVGKGMIWGNIIGVVLCLIQRHFHIVTLNPEAYYVPYVPIEINFWYVLWLNIGCMLVSVLMLIAPSYLVALIRPAKSIKFE